MFGLGARQVSDRDSLSVFVNTIKSAEAFGLAEKVWQNNARTVMFDQANNKELLRFVFSQPTCVVWLQRDKGEKNSLELILVWGTKPKDVTEVYVITPALPTTAKDNDSRVRSLLGSILSSPATVAINQQQRNPQAPAKGGK